MINIINPFSAMGVHMYVRSNKMVSIYILNTWNLYQPIDNEISNYLKNKFNYDFFPW